MTFDVDGTLIRSVGDDANKFHKDAFAFGGVVRVRSCPHPFVSLSTYSNRRRREGVAVSENSANRLTVDTSVAAAS